MNSPVVIIGAGGHARVLAEGLVAAGHRLLGYCDPALPPGGTGPFGVPVLGGDEVLDGLNSQDVAIAIGIGLTHVSRIRRRLFDTIAARGFRFATLIHPAAIVAPDVTVGPGAQIMAGAVVQTGSSVGANAIINTRAAVDHDCVIADHAHIAPGVTLCGGVRVGTASHVGAGTVVIEGISVGAGVLVGAGSTVLSDIADDARVFGLIKKQSRAD